MKRIKLIATDYDDTLVTQSETMVLVDSFANILNYLSEQDNTKWAIVTGRSFFSLRKALRQFARRGMVPDFLVVSEGYIFRKTMLGYLPLIKWNIKMWQAQRKIIFKLRKIIAIWKSKIETRWSAVSNRSLGRTHLWYEFYAEEHLQEAIKFLEKEVLEHSGLVVFNTKTELYLGVSYCCKGVALKEISKILSVKASEVFAIGDGVNDISMLSGDVARKNACVGNACAKVKACVSESGGYVASNENILGVIESLNFYIGQCK
ncbi:MAG: HAD family hydrolase [Lentisphaeria bacterium]